MTRPGQQLPLIRRSWLRWFSKYAGWYLRRNFHGLHLLSLAPLDSLPGEPLLLCLNHPSWWDPLVALYLSQRFFPERSHYGPIDAEAVKRYAFFEKLGFFGIERGTAAGAAKFLRTARLILRDPHAALWVTPQGHFSDARTRPVQLTAGVAHLPKHVASFMLLPVALEYAFWNERFPEAFVCFGQPLLIRGSQDVNAQAWTQTFAGALERTQDALAAAVLTRDAKRFQPLLRGGAGVGGVYDLWRAAKAKWHRKPFVAEHGG